MTVSRGDAEAIVRSQQDDVASPRGSFGALGPDQRRHEVKAIAERGECFATPSRGRRLAERASLYRYAGSLMTALPSLPMSTSNVVPENTYQTPEARARCGGYSFRYSCLRCAA